MGSHRGEAYEQGGYEKLMNEGKKRFCVNAKLLRVHMVLKDKRPGQICADLGICRSAWSRKLRGESEFTQGEIGLLRQELDLDDRETCAIFFDPNVS